MNETITTIPNLAELIELAVNHASKPVARKRGNTHGRKTEVFAYELNDLHKMLEYFEKTEQDLHRLMLVLSCNMARRCGDSLRLTWRNFYDESGKIREEILAIREEKTDKFASPHINSAVKKELEHFTSKYEINPKEHLDEPVFVQLTGTHKGHLLTENGHLKALKKAAVAVGITYNIGTHSGRKTFGKYSRMIHPNDYDSMEILQSIYNHSNTKTTKNYIGLTKEKVNEYYEDIGNFFEEFAVGGKEFKPQTGVTTTAMANELRQIIQLAFECGKNAKGNDLDTLTELYELLDEASL